MDHNCYVEPIEKSASAEEQQATTAALLAVEGMGCPNCAARVRNSLLSLTGVVAAAVVLDLGVADVIYKPNLVDIPTLVSAVAHAGGDGRHEYRAQLLSGPSVKVAARPDRAW